jgi:hypothetical protein
MSAWLANRGVQYETWELETVPKRFKTSDTVFILGSGPSVNDFAKEQWEHISKHDSIGLNWWPLHDFVPTYYYTNYPRDPRIFKRFARTLGPKIKRDYGDTLFLVSGDRARCRGIHPRVFPDIFPDNANLCFYAYPKPIRFENEPKHADFADGVFHRGALTLALDLMLKIGYRNVVLVGIDLNDRSHFYDKRPEMAWQFETGYRGGDSPEEVKRIPSVSEETSGKRKLPLSEYMGVVNEFHFEPNGLKLFTTSQKSKLPDTIPFYAFTTK